MKNETQFFREGRIFGEVLARDLGMRHGFRKIKPNANCDVNLIELLFDNYRLKFSVLWLRPFFFVGVASPTWHLI